MMDKHQAATHGIKLRPKCRNLSSDPALDSVPEFDQGWRLSSLALATPPPPEHERNMLAPSERHLRWPGTNGFLDTAPVDEFAVEQKSPKPYTTLTYCTTSITILESTLSGTLSKRSINCLQSNCDSHQSHHRMPMPPVMALKITLT